MNKVVMVAVLVLGCSLGNAALAGAQIFTPSYMSPQQGGDLGIYLSEGPGDFGLEGIWRTSLGAYDLGLRAGIAETDDALFLLGAELRNPLRVVDFPLALAFTAGAQAAFEDETVAGFEAGVSIGKTFVPGDFSFTPYIHPRVGLISGMRDGPEDEDDDLEAAVLADIGFDFEFQPNLTFRIGLGLGDETADWGIGLAWR